MQLAQRVPCPPPHQSAHKHAGAIPNNGHTAYSATRHATQTHIPAVHIIKNRDIYDHVFVASARPWRHRSSGMNGWRHYCEGSLRESMSANQRTPAQPRTAAITLSVTGAASTHV